ncbi:uncharacterized protein BYT42DRAFT_610131 [Radiomyces spectabilis]|uniref:uncharacterized protein n=1 Tax=Radiomyces spectabilis TaxID=64574 RepID=UPI00221FDF6B|nr:uncharacterized protein BYT42DRAFT_610131 [Radiomyces spectabilis]KAI8390859.1 hypothetical protein BYT42DRAFT_610131 [Radiomyces spectabilis]
MSASSLLQSPSFSSLPSSSTHSEKSPTTVTPDAEFNDFFVYSFDHGLDMQCQDADSWRYALSKVRQQMYNSTSVFVPSPAAYLHGHQSFAIKSMPQYEEVFNYNANSHLVKDLSTYRQMRSENLLMRMIHCSDILSIDIATIMRLKKGVFVHQKSNYITPQPSPTSSTIEEFNKQMFPQDAEASIETFYTDNVKSMISTTGLESSSYAMDTFVPYSYTFGARYTNPYGGAQDILIRGQIPLWCQILFLSSCVNQMPIRPHETRSGLFPFAPNISVTFGRLAEAAVPENEISPDLGFMYERFAMDISEPEMLLNDDDGCGHTWAERKQEILQQTLYCNIPDHLAAIITGEAAIWAAQQSLIV